MHVRFSCFSKSCQLEAHPVACKPGDSCSWMEFGQHVNVAFVLLAATCQMAAEEMTRSHFSLLISQCVAQCVSCWPHIILFTRIRSLSQNWFCSYNMIKVSELGSFSRLLLQHRAMVDFGGWIYYFISKIIFFAGSQKRKEKNYRYHKY